MKNIIIEMIEKAQDEQDFDLAKITKELIDELAETWNAPSNWRDIGEKIAKEYDEKSWIYEAMNLYEYEETQLENEEPEI